MTMPDLRPQLAQSQEWVAQLIDGLRPDQLDAPTPCDGWDVRALLEHLMAVQDRVHRIGAGGELGDAPTRAALPDSSIAAHFREHAAQAQQAWSDDSRLSALVSPPWGQVPGGAAVAGYVQEHLVHGWDLAVATGQPSEADPALVGPSLAAAREFLPPHPRGGDIPFGEVVEPAPDAGLTEQLANYLGRRR